VAGDEELRVSVAALKRELADAEDPHRAFISQSFFKTGNGEYGEGDVFLGLTVPAQRKLAKKYRTLPLAAIQSLLKSKIHEHRLVALLILVDQYTRGDANTKDGLFAFYLVNAKRVNNWDLVDSSAPYIIGAHLLTRSRKLLRDLAKSENLWERRIAIVATLWLIRAGELDDTFAVSRLLLKDKHDLIHKAVGWMLREAGKKSPDRLRQFLAQHHALMPRTALRYAIERFPESERKQWLLGTSAEKVDQRTKRE
jgi:3-methyladenine DNA glycosylase AlkD